MEYQEEFTADELSSIEYNISNLAKKYDSIESQEFVEECALESDQLPYRIRKLLYDFRNQKHSLGFILLKGFVVNDEMIGETPSHWDSPWKSSRTLREEIFQCLICSGMGDIFGWKTQENGRLLRNIVPVKKDQDEQLGGSSRVELQWHIEEAFHPQRADMMTIMCYRNEEKAGTNVCTLGQLSLPKEIKQVLMEPRFIIEPDKSHFPENNQSNQWRLESEHFKKIRSFLSKPKPVPVIFGPPGFERIVVDQAFMTPVTGDSEAEQALSYFHSELNNHKTTIEMVPGDIILLDNRRVVHGRTPYQPNYGPKARWLRRGNISADLTKSYEWKETPYARAIL